MERKLSATPPHACRYMHFAARVHVVHTPSCTRAFHECSIFLMNLNNRNMHMCTYYLIVRWTDGRTDRQIWMSTCMTEGCQLSPERWEDSHLCIWLESHQIWQIEHILIKFTPLKSWLPWMSPTIWGGLNQQHILWWIFKKKTISHYTI